MVIVINDVDRIATKEHIDLLMHLQSLASVNRSCVHLVFVTFQPFSVFFDGISRTIVYDPLTLEQIHSIVNKSLDEGATEQERGIIKKFVDRMYVYHPSRMFVLTMVFEFYEMIHADPDISDSQLTTTFNRIIQPFVVGHEEVKEQLNQFNTDSFHQNYLLHIAWRQSSGGTKSVKIPRLFNEYTSVCPHPLSFSMFLLLFRSCAEEHYFIASKADCPLSVDSYKVSLTKRQYETIDSILFGHYNAETDTF